METLLQKINRNIIFYISRKLLEQHSGRELSSLDEIRMTSNLVHIDSEGNTKYITSGFRSIALLAKERELNGNVFELLKMKSTIEKNAFSFLLDNYFTELDTWIKITDMIKRFAKHETVNYLPIIQDPLDLQYRVLVHHKEKIKEHFGDWKLRVDLERVFGNPPPIKKIEINKKFFKDTNTNDSIEKTKNIKKKTQLITEKEVDNYLLKTIFNVNPTRINKKTQ